MNIENSTLDHAKKNHIIGEGANPDEPQADRPSNCHTKSEMDPRRLKRMLANRASAQRSRTRKMEYMEELEKKAKSYQDIIAAFHPQIASCKNRQWFLLIEQHKLKLQMAAREKERILQEVEIEKNKEEVNRLSELERKLIVASRARMVNVDATMHLMSNSNSNTSDFGRFICSNSAQNGIGTSRMQTDMSQNQSQTWMNKWNNWHRSTPNSNFVKSEPAN